MAPKKGRRERGGDSDGFEKRFEDAETLQGLLEIAGSPRTLPEVEALLKEGLAQERTPAQVFPALFDEEPRFPDPSYARRLYGNLFGAWELVRQGRSLSGGAAEKGGPRPKKVRAEPPGLFGEAPDEAWMTKALDYLEQVEGRERDRLEHAFEQRADGALYALDEQGFSDEAFFWAQPLLFRLFALLELGRPEGAGRIPQTTGDVGAVPSVLEAHVAQTLQAARTDVEHPLAEAEAERLSLLIGTALQSFWSGRSKR